MAQLEVWFENLKVLATGVEWGDAITDAADVQALVTAGINGPP